jgi:hypothetical protein
MNLYAYKLIQIEPIENNYEDIEEQLNEYGQIGYRYVDTQSLWVTNTNTEAFKRNFMILEKTEEDL